MAARSDVPVLSLCDSTVVRASHLGRLFCLILLLATGFRWQAVAQTTYVLTDLGTLGGVSSFGFGLNAAGNAVGSSFLSGPLAPQHAFLYAGGPISNLGTLGGDFSEARAINSTGKIVGGSQLAGFLAPTHAFLYSSGSMTDLGTLGGGTSEARSINSGGDIVGWSQNPLNQVRAFLYTGGSMVGLGTLGGSVSRAYAINDSGRIVGESTTTTMFPIQTHAFVYIGGTMTDIGTLGGNYSSAYGINASGQIVGASHPTGQTVTRAFLYSLGSMTDLGSLSGGVSQANAINSDGKVVGKSTFSVSDPGFHAFLYADGAMTDLNDRIPSGTGWTLIEASAINDAGQIVGTGFSPDGFQHAFLLTPGAAPSPSSLYTLTPCRLIDTRNPPGPLGGPSLTAGATRNFPIVGNCAIPTGAKAVVLNVVVIATAPNFLTVFPGGTPRPLASTVNASAGQVRANNAIVLLGSAGDLNVYLGQAAGASDVVIDTTGYFQ